VSQLCSIGLVFEVKPFLKAVFRRDFKLFKIGGEEGFQVQVDIQLTFKT